MSGEYLPGRRPPNFTIENNALVAEGTTAEIHLARIDGSRPRYAAKVLRSTQERDEKLFDAEIQTYKLFERENPPHPHIVRFHGDERDDHNGHHYFVMDLASEGALKGTDDRVKRLPALGVHRVVKEIGSALGHVHGFETVHGNINSRDILMHKKGADRRNPAGPITFWLSDWGDSATLNQQNPSLGGDPLYRAPEKFDGQVTKAGDLYSFAATTYELLTGKPPFDLPELSPAGIVLLQTDPKQRRLIEPDMAHKHNHVQVPLFSDRWDDAWLLDEKDTALRLAVEEDVHKALSVEPENRQGSVAEFVANFSKHMLKAKEEQDKHRETITSSEKGKRFVGDYRPVSRRMELPEEKDRTALRDRDLTKGEHAELRRITKALGTPRGRSADALAQALSKSMWFKEHNPAQRKALVKLYLEQAKVAGILQGESDLSDAARLGQETAFKFTTSAELAQLAKNYRDHEAYLAKHKKGRKIRWGIGAAAVAASATLVATSGVFEGPQKPETIAALPDYKKLPQKEKDLMLAQQEQWQKFFGGYIAIPRPPQELFETLDKLKNKGYDTFKPLYFPEITTTKDVTYPGWKEKPHELLYDQDDNDQRTTTARWVLVDTRVKPKDFKGGIGRLVDKLKHAKEAENREGGTTNWQEKRTASGDEIKTVILPTLAKEIGVDKSNVVLPTMLEYNILGNVVNYASWDAQSDGEWVNTYRPDDRGQQIVSGDGSEGGVGYSEYGYVDEAKIYLGFRPVINFPLQPSMGR